MPSVSASSSISPDPRAHQPATGTQEGFGRETSAFASMGGAHIPALDGVRGLAVLVVLIFHFTMYSFHHSPVLHFILTTFKSGWIGVDLFFVLSGFLITGILYDSKSSNSYFKAFYMRRVFRIFPLYYVYLLLMIVLLPALFPERLALPPGVAEHQWWLWVYGTNVIQGYHDQWIFTEDWLMSTHLWSLAVEEHFYLAWPLIVFLLGRRRLILVCVGCIIFALGFRWALTMTGSGFVAVTVFTFCRIDSLATGALIALVARDPEWRRLLLPAARWLGAAALIGVLGLAVWCRRLSIEDVSTRVIGFTLLALLFGAMLILALTAKRGTWQHWFWTGRPMLFLGKYSYGIYLLHLPLIPFLDMILPLSLLMELTGSYIVGVFAYALIGMTGSILAAMVSWHLMEKHFLKLKKYFEYRERQPRENQPAVEEEVLRRRAEA